MTASTRVSRRRSAIPGKNHRAQQSPAAFRARRKFLRFYPGGFQDPDYVELERDYKWNAHRRWEAELGRPAFTALLRAGRYERVAALAVGIESRTNLLFSFEKMALRDAVRSDEGAETFTRGLYQWLHGAGSDPDRFDRWCEAISSLPRRQTRVLTWPLVTVFGFLALPSEHMFLKPRVTQEAAAAYGVDFTYQSRPNWRTYASLLSFAERVRRDTRDMRPLDMIDLQSFIWVQGSDEYEE